MATPLHSETTGLLVALLATCTSGRGENLNVLPKNSGKTMMRSYLRRLADADFARRKKVIASLTSVEKIEQHQQRMQTFFWRQLGGMPKRTPLNAKIVGRLRVDRCRIEKVIFESRPNHFVTATLYLPVGKGPFPAVLIPCGHTHAGKASNQRLGIFFAQSGIAAFTYDPIGQGERYQILDGKGKNRFKSTTEHTLVGISCILVGRSTASYRVWDGIRAIDYLVSRKDIDSSRIGCTGVSGGGTLTEYLMALDERIQCAAPACAPMTFARRLATIGPGDAEQNIYGQIAFGMDHSDYTHMRAPKPTLILAATRDFVDIQGAWDLFREAKQIYTRMGKSERVDIIEADAKHGFSLKLREGSVRWMRRWLLGKDDAVSEPEVKTLPFRQLLCTKTGQAQQIENAKSVMDLNLDVVKKYEATRKELWKPGNRNKALSMVLRLSGIR